MIEYRFEQDGARAYDQGVMIGYCTFQLDEDALTIEHTVVDGQYQGQGIALKLANMVIDFAKERGIYVIPQCSYIAHLFEKYPEQYAKVIPPK